MLNLSTSSLDWALKQAERSGDSSIFPRPFEFSAIRHDWDTLKTLLTSKDILGWTMRPNRYCLTLRVRMASGWPRSLDPRDWLIYNSLVYEIGMRLSLSVYPSKTKSYSPGDFKPQSDGTMFDRTIGYKAFLDKMRELANKSDEQYVVVTDITDFYPKLGHHSVENALSAAAPQKTNHAKAIVRLLSAWRAGQSFGLPVGPNASRLIAEIASMTSMKLSVEIS